MNAQASPCTYYVDEKQQQTSKDQLTVQRILEKAGVEVAATGEADALLYELRGGQQVPYTNLTQTIPINDGMKFVTAPIKATGGNPPKTNPGSNPPKAVPYGSGSSPGGSGGFPSSPQPPPKPKVNQPAESSSEQ